MAVYFWIGTESTTPAGEWDAASNWSTTEGGSAGSSSPSSGDIAIVPASATYNITYIGLTAQVDMYIQLGSYGILPESNDGGILTCNLAVFKNNGSVLSGNVYINGTCVFMGGAVNYGMIDGASMFIGSTNGGGGFIGGDCLLTASQNSGQIVGNCQFVNSSDNTGTVVGTATFNGYDASGSTNTGIVGGLELKLPENYISPGYTVRPLDVLGAGI